MKRILFLSTCVRGGGAGWSLYSLVKNLERSRFEARVAVPTAGIFSDLYRALGVPLVEIPVLPERMTSPTAIPIQVAGLARTAGAVAKLARNESVDLIYCNNMLTKPVGWLAGSIARRPVVFHCRNIHDTWARAAFYPRLARSAWVKKVICNSKASREPYARFVSGKAIVVYNGVDADRFSNGVPAGRLRSERGLTKGTPIVGYFGNLIPRKGADVLMESIPHLLSREPKAQLAIVGDRPVGGDGRFKERLLSRSRELGVDHAVHFIGAVPDIRPYLRDVTVAAVPSIQEPFGRVVIEAMAMGVPVVATSVGGIPEIIRSGENGLLVPPNDPAALSEALHQVIHDRERASRFSNAGQETVRTRFAAPVITRQIESVLQDI